MKELLKILEDLFKDKNTYGVTIKNDGAWIYKDRCLVDFNKQDFKEFLDKYFEHVKGFECKEVGKYRLLAVGNQIYVRRFRDV